jgi:hypothetical protein
MTAEEFDALKCGDCVRNESTGDAFMVNQVRAPGFYSVVRVDAETFERLGNQQSVMRSSEGLTLAHKKAAR